MQIPYLGLLHLLQAMFYDWVAAGPSVGSGRCCGGLAQSKFCSFAFLQLVSYKVENRKHDWKQNASLFWRGAFIGKCSQGIQKDLYHFVAGLSSTFSVKDRCASWGTYFKHHTVQSERCERNCMAWNLLPSTARRDRGVKGGKRRTYW